jgi:hypothetical protein
MHPVHLYAFMVWTWTASPSVGSRDKFTFEIVALRLRGRVRNELHKAYRLLRNDASNSVGKCNNFGETDCLFLSVES